MLWDAYWQCGAQTFLLNCTSADSHKTRYAPLIFSSSRFFIIFCVFVDILHKTAGYLTIWSGIWVVTAEHDSNKKGMSCAKWTKKLQNLHLEGWQNLSWCALAKTLEFWLNTGIQAVKWYKMWWILPSHLLWAWGPTELRSDMILCSPAGVTQCSLLLLKKK